MIDVMLNPHINNAVIRFALVLKKYVLIDVKTSYLKQNQCMDYTVPLVQTPLML